jgi:hypothetical protein
MMGTCSQDDERRVSNGKDGGVTLKNNKRKKCLFAYFLGGNWGCWVDTKTQWGHCQATLRKN